MINYILFILIMVALGVVLGQIALIQSFPAFKLIKKHPFAILCFYYGFYIGLLFEENGVRNIIRFSRVRYKIVIFSECFCYSLEKYIEKHPQKAAKCKHSIKYINSSSIRKDVYSSYHQRLACA